MKKTILSVIVAANFTAAVYAGDFALNSISAADLKASRDTLQAVPAPAQAELLGLEKSPNLPSPVLDLTLKLPFKALNSRLTDMPGMKLEAIDPSAPILFRQGDHITFGNVTVTYDGLDIEPTVLIKPYFEGNNRLALKVMRVEADVVFGPKAVGQLDKDGLMETVMTGLSSSMMEAMDKAFTGNKVANMKAKDVISFNYDRKSWTLHMAVSPGFVAPLLPGLIDNINLTAFSFDDSGFSLGVKSGSAASVAQVPGCNLVISDGLLDNFILQFTKGTDFEFHPKGHEGGLRFRADGRMELAGKIYARDVFGKPNVYFTAIIKPEVIGPNLLRVKVEGVDVDQAFGIGIPGFISNWLQGKIIGSMITTLTTDKTLSKVMTAKKLDDKTVQIALKSSSFLPSFSEGAVINNLKIGKGLMYLGLEL